MHYFEPLKWWIWLREVIPQDAYKICTGRLFISITILTWLGPKNMIVSEFTSNQDLFECCLASSSIPYLTHRYGIRNYRSHWVVDGGITNNVPVFSDGLRRQMVISSYMYIHIYVLMQYYSLVDSRKIILFLLQYSFIRFLIFQSCSIQ